MSERVPARWLALLILFIPLVNLTGHWGFRFPYQAADGAGTVCGGVHNQASDFATVCGGSYNAATAYHAVVSGGSFNTASVEHATISGGTNNTASASRATIGGGYGNNASRFDATIGGGSGNVASGSHATVSGGSRNISSGRDATIGGGVYNTADATQATVGGGTENDATGFGATIGGGAGNSASAAQVTVGGGLSNQGTDVYATVGGGYRNTASGAFSTVPGGSLNQAAADHSQASGHRAIVAADHDGAFLFADSTDVDFRSLAADEFAVRASGGIRFVTAVDSSGDPVAGVDLAAGSGSWATLSGREVKANMAPVDDLQALALLADLPISTWNYVGQDPSIRHIGPTAQNFRAAFGVGEDDQHINTVDADGVALAAIQGLYQLVQAQDAQLRDQQQQIAALEARLAALEERSQIPR